MFGLGLQELVVILVIVLIIFGAGKLPSIFSSLGKGLRNFKLAASGQDVDENKVDNKTDNKIENKTS